MIDFTEPTEEDIAQLKAKYGVLFSCSIGGRFFIFRGLTRGDLKEIYADVMADITKKMPKEVLEKDIESLAPDVQTEFVVNYNASEEEHFVKTAVVWPDFSGLTTDEFDKAMPANVSPKLHYEIKKHNNLIEQLDEEQPEVKKL